MMKTKYTTPIIEIEELTKLDVLCASREGAFNTPDNSFNTYEGLGEFWDLSGNM